MRFITVTTFSAILACMICTNSKAEPNSPSKTVRDINDVYTQGDCTLSNMKVEKAYFADGSFLVVTTGGRFEYTTGEMKVYQGLGQDLGRRLVATLSIVGAGKFEKIESTNDHVLLWSENLNIGIYGDSTCIISPKINTTINCKGNFKPDYEGRHEGELLLIDSLGGMQIYPQRYETGYKVAKIDLGKTDWIANYEFKAKERIMLAAFPGRPFDWDKSFKSNVMFVHGFSVQLTQMLKINFIKNVSNAFNVVGIWHEGFYKAAKYDSWVGPYTVAEPGLFKTFLQSSHSNGLKVIAYCSYVYHYDQYKDSELFFNELKNLKTNFDIDGVYIDGTRFDIGLKKLDDKIDNWKMIRRLRELFGSNGYIMLHDTSLGTPVSTTPPIDAYCDSVLKGENVPFRSFDDPYIKYHVRKYGISNTVALWKPGPHPKSISNQAIIDALLAMQGREWYFFDGSFDSYLKLSPDYQYYLQQLSKLKDTSPK